MPDPDFISNNFNDTLEKSGIAITYVDYNFDDTHESILNRVKETSEQYQFLFGYSYGCMPALMLSNKNTKGIILLDPSSVINHNQKKYILEIDQSNIMFEADIAKRNSNLFTKYPRIEYSKINCPVLIIYTEYAMKNKTDGVKVNLLKNKKIIEIPDSSHYIMMEPRRFDLVKHISEFINA